MTTWTAEYIAARERGIQQAPTSNDRLRLAAIMQYEFIGWLAKINLSRSRPSAERISALANLVQEVVKRLEDPRATDGSIPCSCSVRERLSGHRIDCSYGAMDPNPDPDPKGAASTMKDK